MLVRYQAALRPVNQRVGIMVYPCFIVKGKFSFFLICSQVQLIEIKYDYANLSRGSTVNDPFGLPFVARHGRGFYQLDPRADPKG
jgi:hypothetical protein